MQKLINHHQLLTTSDHHEATIGNWSWWTSVFLLPPTGQPLEGKQCSQSCDWASLAVICWRRTVWMTRIITGDWMTWYRTIFIQKVQILRWLIHNLWYHRGFGCCFRMWEPWTRNSTVAGVADHSSYLVHQGCNLLGLKTWSSPDFSCYSTLGVGFLNFCTCLQVFTISHSYSTL